MIAITATTETFEITQLPSPAGPTVEPLSWWDGPGGSGRNWELENVVMLGGEPYARLSRLGSYEIERCMVPVLTLVTEWGKQGHKYPEPVRHFVCDGCAETLDATLSDAERVGWTHYGMGGGTWCPRQH